MSDQCKWVRKVHQAASELHDTVWPDCGKAAKGKGGPAKVATEAYRDGWDTIFGSRQKAGEA